MNKADLQDLALERMSATYLDTYAGEQGDTYGEWQGRIRTFRDLYAGRWNVTFPNEFSIRDRPKVMNMLQVSADDIARMAGEVIPMVKVKPPTGKDKDKKNAYLKEKIYQTYWMVNRGEQMVPSLALDMASTGMAAIAVTAPPPNKSGMPRYPKITRLDPLGCYPNMPGGELLDMVVVGEYKPAQAAQILKLQPSQLRAVTSVEIIDYYDDFQVFRAWRGLLNGTKIGDAQEGERWIHDLGYVPVAVGRLATADGAFRGLFDQVDGVLQAMNRILHLELDYASQQVYSPLLSYQIENDREAPGPRTIYRKLTESATLERVPPAGSNPNLMMLMQFLENQGRQGIGYPGQRQGDVPQSVGSASFVNSTQGQLSTIVRTIQEEIGFMRQHINLCAAKIDKKFLNKEKPLSLSSDEEHDYTPGTVFADDNYSNLVLYGAGAGLDRPNARVAILQDLGAGITSKKTAREQTPYILDEEEEGDQKDLEDVQDIYKQKLLQGGDIVTLSYLIVEMKKNGKNLDEAADVVAELVKAREERAMQMEQAAKQPSAPAAPAAPETGVGAPGEPPGMAGATGPSVPAGPPGIMGVPPQPAQLPPAAMEQIFAQTQRGA